MALPFLRSFLAITPDLPRYVPPTVVQSPIICSQSYSTKNSLVLAPSTSQAEDSIGRILSFYTCNPSLKRDTYHTIPTILCLSYLTFLQYMTSSPSTHHPLLTAICLFASLPYSLPATTCDLEDIHVGLWYALSLTQDTLQQILRIGRSSRTLYPTKCFVRALALPRSVFAQCMNSRLATLVAVLHSIHGLYTRKDLEPITDVKG